MMRHTYLDVEVVPKDGAREHIFRCQVIDQAVDGAKEHARRSGEVVEVTAHYENGSTRSVRYYPDGRVLKLWQPESCGGDVV